MSLPSSNIELNERQPLLNDINNDINNNIIAKYYNAKILLFKIYILFILLLVVSFILIILTFIGLNDFINSVYTIFTINYFNDIIKIYFTITIIFYFSYFINNLFIGIILYSITRNIKIGLIYTKFNNIIPGILGFIKIFYYFIICIISSNDNNYIYDANNSTNTSTYAIYPIINNKYTNIIPLYYNYILLENAIFIALYYYAIEQYNAINIYLQHSIQ